MNWYLYLFRLFKYWCPNHPDNWRRNKSWREAILGGNWLEKILYELSWVDFGLYKLLKRWGEQTYIYSPSVNNAECEIRWETFRRFELYVEGYMAHIAYRFHKDAPRPMPPDEKTRKKWGLRVLRAQAEKARNRPDFFPSSHMPEKEREKFAHDCEEKARRWEELARIYQVLQNWPWWEDEAPLPDFKDTQRRGRLLDFGSDAKKQRFEKMMSRPRRLQTAQAERLENMYRRLIDRKDLLRYD